MGNDTTTTTKPKVFSFDSFFARGEDTGPLPSRYEFQCLEVWKKMPQTYQVSDIICNGELPPWVVRDFVDGVGFFGGGTLPPELYARRDEDLDLVSELKKKTTTPPPDDVQEVNSESSVV